MGLRAVKLREASGVEKEGIIRPGAVRWRLSTLLALLCFKLIMSHRNPEKTCPSVHGEESWIVAQLANVPHTISKKKGGRRERERKRRQDSLPVVACLLPGIGDIGGGLVHLWSFSGPLLPTTGILRTYTRSSPLFSFPSAGASPPPSSPSRKGRRGGGADGENRALIYG